MTIKMIAFLTEIPNNASSDDTKDDIHDNIGSDNDADDNVGVNDHSDDDGDNYNDE